jgi:hypothetical protein
MIITGTYNLVVDPQWRNVQQQEVFLECDTSSGAVTINLFEITELNRFWNVKIIISDYANKASLSNIFINAGGSDKIDQDGTVQIILNNDGESVTFQPVSENNWIALESVNGGSGTIPTLQEVLDNNHDLVDGNNFQGTLAGLNNTGAQVNAFGEGAGQENSSTNINAFGFNSAISNSGKDLNAMGYQAGYSNQGESLNAFGNGAGTNNRGDSVNAFGANACFENTGNNVHGFGINAGRKNQQRHAVFIGANAGYDSATDTGNSIAEVFVINNAVLPSFANSVDAQTAITVSNGAVAGNTYLYYDVSKGVIGGIRL